MVPVNEGDKECYECEYFDIMFGCIPTYVEGDFPPCGRDIVISQEYVKKILKGMKECK